MFEVAASKMRLRHAAQSFGGPVRYRASLHYLRSGLLTFYLQIVFYVMEPSRRLRPKVKLGQMLRRAFRRLARPVPLTGFVHNGGHCYTATINGNIPSDANSTSRVRIYEDGVPLATPHADHQSIRDKGLGRYSHWNGSIFLSASDNTNPATNGRSYTYCEIDPALCRTMREFGSRIVRE